MKVKSWYFPLEAATAGLMVGLYMNSIPLGILSFILIVPYWRDFENRY